MIRSPSFWLHGVFFVSGVAGLGYEIVWTRMFAFGLGHEMGSLLAVVAAFFGGFGIGALLLDRRVSRSAVPGRWYAWLEAFIGLWALVTIALIPVANRAAADLIGLNPSAGRHWLVSFMIPFLALLPATLAMGATLPAMERLVARLRHDGKTVAGLYSVNTAGAVAGTLLATFVLLPAFGFTATLVVLAVLNLLCAAAVGLGSARDEDRRADVDADMPGTPGRLRLSVLIFGTGLLGIGYEVVCVRAMDQVLENTVYSFASALSIYLVGTALGAALYQRFLKSASFQRPLAVFLQCLACACLLGIWVLGKADPIYRAVRAWLGGDVAGSIAAEMVLALCIFFLPTLLMGAAFSHLALAARRLSGGIGQALGVNTLGASLAPVVFGVVLLTQAGVKGALLAVALGYLPLLFLIPGLRLRWLIPAVAVLPLFVLLPPDLVHVNRPADSRLVIYREGIAASVAVVENREGTRFLKVNNRFIMGATSPTFSERRLAHIPLLLHPDPRRVLFLGVGTGITAGAATCHPGLAVTGVELLPEVLEILPLFEPANRLSRLAPGAYVPADARRFIRATGERYDVIVGDLFHPSRDGAGALYTREHFQSVRARLADGGLFCQWLPLYQLDDEMVRLIVRTFLSVFPDATAHIGHFNTDSSMLGLVGSLKRHEYGEAWFERRVTDAALATELEEVALSNGLTLFGTLVAGTGDLRTYAGDGPLNTDDHPRVIFRAPLFAYRKDAAVSGRIERFLDACRATASDLPISDAGEGAASFSVRLDRTLAARDIYLRATIDLGAGRRQEAVNRLLESVRTSRDFRTAYAACLELALDRERTDRATAMALLRALQEARPDEPLAGACLREMEGD